MDRPQGETLATVRLGHLEGVRVTEISDCPTLWTIGDVSVRDRASMARGAHNGDTFRE